MSTLQKRGFCGLPPCLFPQELEHLGEKSSKPSGLVKAGPDLLKTGLDGNFAVITTTSLHTAIERGTPGLKKRILIEDTIERKYAGVFNKNMMEENIQSSIIRSNLRCERRCVIPTPHPPWLGSVRDRQH